MPGRPAAARRVHHLYTADLDAPADHKGTRPCRCGLPERNGVHQLPNTHDEQAAHRARTGDKEDDR